MSSGFRPCCSIAWSTVISPRSSSLAASTVRYESEQIIIRHEVGQSRVDEQAEILQAFR